MANRRKSAFSVYTETKQTDEPQPIESISNNKKQNGCQNRNNPKNNNHIVPSGDQNDVKKKTNLSFLKTMKGGVSKSQVVQDIKKEKKKFHKIPIERVSESIQMFNNNNDNQKKTSNGHQYKKKAFASTVYPESKFPTYLANNLPITKKLIPQLLTETNFGKIYKAEKTKVPKDNLKILKEFEEKDNDSDIGIDEEMFDSRKEASNLFKNIISPVTNKEFFKVFWEKKPMLIKRDDSTYYKNWFSCKELNSILRNHSLEFTQNIDVTTYINGVKQNHNPEGRAFAPLVWDFFQQGCSIRLLNPQTYSRNVWKYLSTLQELFGTCVGANIYLTPQGTQGFAPHYDDIEAFVLQLEGKKRWRVYNPLSKEETLPRFSSGNFEQSEIGEPIIDVILEPGDLLYFPRGFIHQAHACDDIHSLHITVSCYQKNSWGDFLSKLLPGAVEIAMQENIEFRRGLPINYLINNGVAFDNEENKKDFVNKTGNLIKNLIKYAPIDSAVDQMAKQFLHDSLPPCLSESEKSRSIHGNGEKWNNKKNRVDNVIELEPDTSIKLIRRNCLRLVVEDNICLVYHSLDNTKIYQEKEPQYLEVDTDVAPAIEFLIKSYPKYVTVEELPLKTDEEKLVVASCLYDKGLLVTGEILISNSDSDSNDEDDEENYEEDEDDDDDEIKDEYSNSESNEGENIDTEEIDDDQFNSEDYDKDNESDEHESNEDQDDDDINGNN